jgi:Flp pilus assembly protein TadG
MRALLREIGRFRRNKSANVAVIFAFAVVPVVSAVGCAVDYTRATQIRSKLQAAVDAASVGSVAKQSPAYPAAGSMTSDGPIPVGVTDATNIFNGNMSGTSGYTLNSMTPVVTKTGGTVTSTVQFSANVPAMFLGVMGKSTMTVTGKSVATASMPIYIDFYLLLDNSPSMGVGATPPMWPPWSTTPRTSVRSRVTTSTTTRTTTSWQKRLASPPGSMCCVARPKA